MVAAQPIYAQTVTSFTYDEKGRLTQSDSDNGDVSDFEYDDANNITRAKRSTTGSPNNVPTCSNQFVYAYSAFHVVNGLTGCSDPDGDTLSLSSVTDPTGPATATKNGNDIHFNNLSCGPSVVSVRTVSDGNGGTVNSNVEIVRLAPGGGGFC